MKITALAIRRPVSAFMIFLCFIVVGIIASRLLPLELFPTLDAPFVSVNIPYPNSTPEEIEREITRPAEEAIATISNIKRMTSNSGESSSDIFLEFEWGVDTDLKAIEAKEKLEAIRNQLPRDLERFDVQKFNTADQAILVIRLSSHRDLTNSFDMLNRNVKRRLERIKGVSRVTMYGVDKPEIRIQLLADRIIAHRINLNSLSRTLQNSNFIVSAGHIRDAGKRFTLRPLGELASIADVKNVIVGPNSLRLSDIAQVNFAMPELEYRRHLNRRAAIGLDIFKESGANVVEVGRQVKAEIKRISADQRMAGINLFLMEDSAEGVESSLVELLKAGFLGALLALFVLYAFLRHWPSTLVVVLATPISLAITLAVMFFAGISLNILSMLGLLLAVGMLVDNAVVVTENIQQHQKHEPDRKQASILAVNEVALAITAGTITTTIVFLPNIFNATNQIGIFMKHISVAFCVALFSSLLIAQTIVPLLASRIRFGAKGDKDRWADRLVGRYRRVLTWLLSHRRASILILLATLFSVAIPVMLVKSDMFSEQEDRRLRIFYNINDSYTLDKVEEAVDKVEEFLFANQERFEIESVYTFFQGDMAQSTILLKKGKFARKTQEAIQHEIRAGLPELPIAKPTFERRRSIGSSDALRIQLVGNSTEELTRLSHEMARRLAHIPGFKNVRSEASIGKKEVHVAIDRTRAKILGVSPQDAAATIAVAMRGVNLRRMHDEDGEINVRVEFQKEDKRTLEQLQDVKLMRSDGEPVKLSALADFKLRQGPTAIFRENRVTSVGVTIDLENLTVKQAQTRIGDIMAQSKLPAGISWNYGRTFDFEDETTQSMLVNTLLAILLIYFVMAALFECLFYPAAIWLSILFAIVGVWWFFLITQTTFDLMAWIGVLILIGVVVNNGIVLIDRINQMRERGLNRHEAIIKAGGDRIRPILMTAGTTVLSLVPLCISSVQIGGDGPPYYSMARAIVGGLIFSTLVTLIILPEIYLLMDDLRNWTWRLFYAVRK